MIWEKINIVTDTGDNVIAQVPIIISASRSTDIPTFYADWFVERWKRGYVKWINPFNNKPSYVSFQNTRCVVFWTKNPKPMMKHIDFLQENVKNFYFQFTLNDYDTEGFEGKLPKLETRIRTFKELSRRIGKDHVVWRFDPLILTDSIDVEELLRRVKNIGDQLKDYTTKLVFSFADIANYRKVARNLIKEVINYKEFENSSMHDFAAGLSKLNNKWGFEIGTCAEKIPLELYGIKHNKCIDDDLMIKLFSHDTKLMKFLGVSMDEPSLFEVLPTSKKKKNLRDKGQRSLCGCILSKDIGQYNTCPHECVYCYANTSKEIALNNYKKFKKEKLTESIVPT